MKKDTSIRILKVVLDTDQLSKIEDNELERWENEGGISVASLPVWSANMPLRKGQIFEVKEINVQYENKEVYGLIEVELLAL